MPRVSVGLPVYNGENYVAESIQSILEQTHQDLELIISDNDSSDATEEICRSIAARDPRVRYYRQSRNLGCALNTNFVFEKATGEYFKWVSHDDLHGPRFVERCVDELDRDPGAIMCCPKGILIDETGREIIMRRNGGRNVYTTASGEELDIRPYDKPKRLDSPDPAKRFKDMICHTNWCLEIYGLVRSKALRQTSLHGTYHGTDKRVLAELALMGRFILLDEVMLFYRQHPVQAKRYRMAAVTRDAYVSGSQAAGWRRMTQVQNLRGFRDAVKRTELTLPQRAACYAGLARWLVQPGKWAPLARDAAQYVRASFGMQKPHRQTREA